MGQRRPYQFWLDLETTGLHTPSYLWGVKPGASEFGPAISEFAFGGVGKSTRVHGYTDIVGQESLKRHGMTLDLLRRKGALPTSMVSELMKEGPNRWDPSVGESGVLGGVFRRHARHVLKNRPTSNLTDLVSGMLGQVERRLGKGGPVELLGWNIAGFDIPTIHGQLRLLAQQTGSEALLRRFEGTMGKVKIKEAAEVYHRLLYDRMLKTNFTPVISNRAAMSAAALRGIKSFGDVSQARKAGALADHTPLRAFMDDVRAHTTGHTAFEARAQSWAKQFMGQAEAGAVGRAMQEQLSGIGTGLESFYGTARKLTATRGTPLMPGVSQSAFDILNMMYRGPDQRHMNILTSPDILGIAADTPVTALNFAGGAKQGQVGASFLQAAQDTGYKHRDLAKLQRRLARGHVAETDRQAAKLLYNSMSRAPERVSERMADIHLTIGNAEKLGLQRVNETMMDLVRSQSETRAATGAARGMEQRATGQALRAAAHNARSGMREALAHTPEHMGPGGNMWVKAGLVVAGLAFLSERNKPKAPIQGLRDPHSDYRQVEGIHASQLPWANVSAFGSGYDYYGSAPSPARITRVIDGDTVEFYKDGKPISVRLVGINTPETHDRKGHRLDMSMPVSVGWSAQRFLQNAVLGQEVMIRPMAGKDHDVFGRQLGFLEMNGMSVNQMMIQQGYSASDGNYIPQPYNGGPGSFGFLKRRMLEEINGVNAWLSGLVSSKPNQDMPLAQANAIAYTGMGGEDEVPQHVNVSSPYPQENWGDEGFAGLTSSLFEGANLSKIRDHATQLHRLPGLQRTSRGRLSPNSLGHAEMACFQNG